MIEYANDLVIKALKQYNMLSKSLELTRDLEQKDDICYQMTRIIKNVLDITNNIYEDKYKKILNRTTYLMDEEKNKLLELINLINERRTYVNNQITSNSEITGIAIEADSILGEDKLDDYKEEVKIIEKYKNNIKLDGTLKEEISKLNVSIKKAKDKISSNKLLNKQLEERMIKILTKAFEKLSLYELKEREKEIDLAYTELGYSLEKAKENAKIARRDCSSEIIIECDNMLASITLEYERYKEKKLILRLMEIYQKETSDYESLLSKREEINSILTGITSSELYLEVGEELNKEYATIKLEQQDKATLKSLEEEKENKTRTLEEINRENDSEEFKRILAHLLENEKKYQEKLAQEKPRKEEERKARMLEEERRKQKEILRRQKALEEERKKEIEERTKQLLVEKKNPILFTNKTEKDNITTKEKENNEQTRKIDRTTTQTSSINNNIGESLSRERKTPPATSAMRQESRLAKNTSPYSTPTRANIKPSEDIFSREKKSLRKVDEGIPVIKNKNLTNDVVSVTKPKSSDEVFPRVKLNKEEDIFPDLPDIDKNDSFFDEDEFNDLNKFVDDNNKSSWF